MTEIAAENLLLQAIVYYRTRRLGYEGHTVCQDLTFYHLRSYSPTSSYDRNKSPDYAPHPLRRLPTTLFNPLRKQPPRP